MHFNPEHSQQRITDARSPKMQTIIKLNRVKSKTALSRSSIYLKMSQGIFPRPISLGTRSVGWIESEVDDWINTQIELSRQSRVQEGAQ